ncbi:MAG TPA: peptidylprolyl isomerase [Polyangiaceae bacterium]
MSARLPSKLLLCCQRAALLVPLACAACVVTTIEGPGDPPRIAPPIPQLSSNDDDDAPPPARHAKQASTPASDEPHEISARHLLVSYRGALRAPPGVGRSKEEARARAEQALKRARAGEKFETLVAEYSDEPGAAERGGNLGKFERNAMVEQFADAAFRLKPGELSDVVETPFGFHVILRTE